MLALCKNRKAQNTMEYAILIAVVVGAFTAMQVYMKRGIQARLKAATDTIPGQMATAVGNSTAGLFGNDTQYEPYYLRESNMTSLTSQGTEKGTISQAGGIREVTNATSSRTGWQTIDAAEEK